MNENEAAGEEDAPWLTVNALTCSLLKLSTQAECRLYYKRLPSTCRDQTTPPTPEHNTLHSVFHVKISDLIAQN